MSDELLRGFRLQHRHKAFDVVLRDDGALELYLDRCLRKRRERGTREPQYVWTNVELEWEEHHYIEARYWHASDNLEVTINGAPFKSGRPEAIGPDYLG